MGGEWPKISQFPEVWDTYRIFCVAPDSDNRVFLESLWTRPFSGLMPR